MTVTTPQIIIPRQLAEEPRGSGGGGAPPQEGAYNGVIEETRTQTLDYLQERTGEQLTRQGFGSADVERVSLQLGQLTGLEGQEETRQKVFAEFIVRDGDLAIEDADPSDATQWQIAASKRLASNLAIALGATEPTTIVNDQGDKEEALAISPNFFEQLRSGGLNEAAVGFEVFHKTFKKRDGTSKTDAEVGKFFPAV